MSVSSYPPRDLSVTNMVVQDSLTSKQIITDSLIVDGQSISAIPSQNFVFLHVYTALLEGVILGYTNAVDIDGTVGSVTWFLDFPVRDKIPRIIQGNISISDGSRITVTVNDNVVFTQESISGDTFCVSSPWIPSPKTVIKIFSAGGTLGVSNMGIRSDF